MLRVEHLLDAVGHIAHHEQKVEEANDSKTKVMQKLHGPVCEHILPVDLPAEHDEGYDVERGALYQSCRREERTVENHRELARSYQCEKRLWVYRIDWQRCASEKQADHGHGVNDPFHSREKNDGQVDHCEGDQVLYKTGKALLGVALVHLLYTFALVLPVATI